MKLRNGPIRKANKANMLFERRLEMLRFILIGLLTTLLALYAVYLGLTEHYGRPEFIDKLSSVKNAMTLQRPKTSATISTGATVVNASQ